MINTVLCTCTDVEPAKFQKKLTIAFKTQLNVDVVCSASCVWNLLAVRNDIVLSVTCAA